ncbi:MAG: glycosyltransferase family 39 protein [Sedimentisphaerales bacterium]|nr:glycosyltransferase family 39 protein [Sedimentisphaerales bacterium]
MNESRKYLYSLLLIAALLTLLLLLKSMNERFNVDEFEHIHSAWYVKNGQTPYRDFFQHHNPLLWYFMAPFLWVFGDTVRSIVVFRFLTLVFTLGIGYMAYLLSRVLTNSKEAGLIAVIMLFSMTMFVRSAVEIRPDVPMVLFGMVSIYCLARFLQSNANRFMALSGFFASVSFLFLQKALFLLFAYAAIFAWQLFRRKMPARALLCFCIFFLLPQLVFAGHLALNDSFRDYIVTNWLFNIARNAAHSRSPFAAVDFTKYLPVFWSLSALGVALILLKKKTSPALKTVAFIPVVLLLSLYLIKGPFNHYFMFPVALLCVVVGCFLKLGFDNLKLPAPARILLIVLIIYMPTKFLTRKICLVRKHSQFEMVDFVLANSSKSDFVYDGNKLFNLYRRDLHYFWFHVTPGKGLDTYNDLTDNKYGDYDICELIRSRRPKFISDFALDIAECGLDKLYDKTEYDGLYIRKTVE